MTAAPGSPDPGAARGRRWLLALAALAALSGLAVEAVSDARHIAAIAAMSGVVLLLALTWLADVGAPQAEIAEHTEAEQELAQARTTIEDLIAVNPAMVFAGRAVEGQLDITFVSEHAYQLLGYPAAEMVGSVERWLSMIHPDDAAAALTAANQAILASRGPAMTSEVRFRHADGTWRWLLINTHYEYGPDGQPSSFVGNAVDISDRKEAEEALAGAKADAERASRAKSEFLSVMSHELRTPLNAILGFGQLLEMSKLSDPDGDSVARILRAGRNLLGLVDQVLEFSRIEAGRLSLSIEPVVLHEVVREALDLARPLAEERGVTIEDTVATEGGPVVLADRRRLAQVLLNLLSNGVQYNRPGGSVTISAEEAGDRVRIAVSDTGLGISEDGLARLFQPFEMTTAGGPPDTGLRGGGLGLAYSKRLVEAMAGTLTVESRVGVGSTFTIELPRAAGAAAEPGGDRDGTVAQAGRVILYIEDNLANLELVEHVLRRRPGVRVLAAMQGRLGLELAREHRPDLVLLDLHLPDVAPDETIRALKADERTRDIPIVVLSSENLPRQAAEMRSLGARDYLTKPLDVAGFLEAVDAAFAEIETR